MCKRFAKLDVKLVANYLEARWRCEKEDHCHRQRIWRAGCGGAAGARAGTTWSCLRSGTNWAGAPTRMRSDGFTFDGGPTVITAPFLFDEIWELAGRKREDYFTLIACDPFYRLYDHEGNALRLQRRPRVHFRADREDQPAGRGGVHPLHRVDEGDFRHGHGADRQAVPACHGHGEGGPRSGAPAVVSQRVRLCVQVREGRFLARARFRFIPC